MILAHLSGNLDVKTSYLPNSSTHPCIYPVVQKIYYIAMLDKEYKE